MQTKLLIFLHSLTLICSALNVKQIYFDPTTSLTQERKDGVIIVETLDGVKSTVCNEDFTNDDAKVMCRMMGYLNGENAFALISSRNSYKTFSVFFSNFSCKGDELTIEDCATFDFKLANAPCQSHEKDVHLYCNSPKIYSKTFNPGNKSDCNNNDLEIRHGNENMGLVFLKSENKSFTLCGINNNFGENEARLFCKLLCFQNVQVARILSNYDVKGAPIGGFRRMKCPSDASSLKDCWDMYSDDSELCTPADNIGVACDITSILPEPKPYIICHNDYMTLEWNITIFPGIESDNVNILDNGSNCTNVDKRTVNGIVSLTVKLDKCNPTVSGNKNHIIFRYKVQRLFHKNRQLVIRNTQNFEATCLLARKEVVDDMDVNLHSIILDPAGSQINLEVKLELSSKFDFSNILIQPYSIKIGSTVYGRISLLNAPMQIELVLQKCYIFNAERDMEVLIDERCAVRNDVKINPVNDTVIKFSYKSYGMRGENMPFFIKCEISKCGKAEYECVSSCQKP